MHQPGYDMYVVWKRISCTRDQMNHYECKEIKEEGQIYLFHNSGLKFVKTSSDLVQLSK